MSRNRFSAPRGTQDLLPAESPRWQALQARFAEICSARGYGEIRTPIFEETELFVRSSGETSEVVGKQMYTFEDRGGRSITLRPEGTAPALRAALEHRLIQPGLPLRMWYLVQNFRYERPQKGRLRQHHQFGAELVGSDSPLADAEVIALAWQFLSDLGLKGLTVRLNSIGRAATRSAFREKLLAHIAPWLADQTEENRARAEANPLRLFDSKDQEIAELMQDAPLILDVLEPESRVRQAALEAELDRLGVGWTLDPRIVRGLDYYTDTVFEIQSGALGAQSAVSGGGRYDGLVEEIGGPPTPSVGFGMGIERLLLILEAEGLVPSPPSGPIFLVCQAQDRAAAEALAGEIRGRGQTAILDLDGRSIKGQMKLADRLGARFSVILGEDESARGVVSIKRMADGSQTEAEPGSDEFWSIMES
ncbi:MAG: histidine--tRNA ligase [Fimbriimonadaceae bacterium]|nr:histidine--tRNA ligase [Fimbriimonadaceae bacterium]